MGVIDALREYRYRAAGHYTRPLDDRFLEATRGARVLEIGGPSRLFDEGGLAPVYPHAASVDNVQFAAATAWHDLSGSDVFAPGGRTVGRQLIIADSDLSSIADATYDVVITSHTIEHLANPLRALADWRRISEALLIVAPHHAGTFDRRRPVTSLEHMVEDFERGTGEDDLTHLDETLELHDFARDVAQDRATWEAERRDNVNTRLLHHHVFSLPSLLALLDHAGLQLDAAEARMPHDIYVAGHWSDAPDNAAFLAARHPSPFRSDR